MFENLRCTIYILTIFQQIIPRVQIEGRKKTFEYFLDAKKTTERKYECCSVMNNISGNSLKEKSQMDSSMHEKELSIILIQEHKIVSHVLGYHKYKSIWIPFVNEKLICRMEPGNALDKYAVAMIKNGSMVSNLMKVESEKFANIFFSSGWTN